MCFNEYVSFGTFIAGTIINIMLYLVFKRKDILAISLIWEWVLLMQFFEGIIWMGIKSNNEIMNTIGTYGAYIANILQPVVFYLCIVIFTKQSPFFHIISILIICAYISYIIYKYFKDLHKKLKNTNNGDNCPHLIYEWWKDNVSAYVYIISLLIIVFITLPHKVFKFQFVIISLTLLLSQITQLKCGSASTWCFLAASAPLLTLIYHKLVGF